EFIPLRWSNQVHELPMLGDVWRYARTSRSGGVADLDAERRELAMAIKAFAGQGNPAPRSNGQKRSGRERARLAAIAEDPMNFTSVKGIEDEKRPADDDNSSIETTSTEEWPNTGGFPLIG